MDCQTTKVYFMWLMYVAKGCSSFNLSVVVCLDVGCYLVVCCMQVKNILRREIKFILY